MRRYRVARAARDDLDNIWEYIAPRGGLRSFPIGNYLTYYLAMRGGRSVVARVLHGMRQQEQQAFENP